MYRSIGGRISHADSGVLTIPEIRNNGTSYSLHDVTSDKLSVAQTLGIIRHRHSFSHHHRHRHHRHGHHHKHHNGNDNNNKKNQNQYGSLGDGNDRDREDARSHSSASSFTSFSVVSGAGELCDWQKDLIAVKDLLLGSYLNIFLLLLPFCFISYYLDWNGATVFFLNFLTMIPLASMLGDATECLAEHLGDTIGGLLNATFGNAVEIVVMLLTLIKAKDYANKDDCENKADFLFVVQTSLIGSIFSNSLLVLGCVLFANGYRYSMPRFNTTAVSSSMSLLMIAGFVMILPTPYAPSSNGGGSQKDVLLVSRCAAVILMLMYICSLIFVLYTHRDILDGDANTNSKSREFIKERANSFSLKPVSNPTSQTETKDNDNNNKENMLHLKIIDDDPSMGKSISNDGGVTTSDKTAIMGIKTDGGRDSIVNSGSDDDDDDELEMSLIGSTILLLVSTSLVALLSEYLVNTIEPMTEKVHMQKAFVGIILIPIIGNAVEHVTAVRMAWKNRMDIALSIAIGSAAQVALFVVPLAVLIAWAMDLDLSLNFESFEVYMFILSTIIIYAIVNDGKSNWLEGVMLLGLYVLIGIAVWDQKLDYSKYGCD